MSTNNSKVFIKFNLLIIKYFLKFRQILQKNKKNTCQTDKNLYNKQPQRHDDLNF